MRSKLFPHQLRFDSSSGRPWKIIAPSFCSFGFLIIKRVKKNKWLLFLLISDCSSHSIRKKMAAELFFLSSQRNFWSRFLFEWVWIWRFDRNPISFRFWGFSRFFFGDFDAIDRKTTNWLVGWLLSERWLMGPRLAWKLTKMFFTNNKNVMEKNQF